MHILAVSSLLTHASRRPLRPEIVQAASTVVIEEVQETGYVDTPIPATYVEPEDEDDVPPPPGPPPGPPPPLAETGPRTSAQPPPPAEEPSEEVLRAAGRLPQTPAAPEEGTQWATHPEGMAGSWAADTAATKRVRAEAEAERQRRMGVPMEPPAAEPQQTQPPPAAEQQQTAPEAAEQPQQPEPSQEGFLTTEEMAARLAAFTEEHYEELQQQQRTPKAGSTAPERTGARGAGEGSGRKVASRTGDTTGSGRKIAAQRQGAKGNQDAVRGVRSTDCEHLAASGAHPGAGISAAHVLRDGHGAGN